MHEGDVRRGGKKEEERGGERRGESEATVSLPYLGKKNFQNFPNLISSDLSFSSDFL